MRIIKSFIIALSMFSKIPVPTVEWKEENMKYVFIFFPFVGAVIGFLILAWYQLAVFLNIPDICRVLVMAAIPLIVTGGIHVDGFMDTMDAVHSYSEKEKKLEILKDPHIGSFSVIMFALYGLIFVGALSLISDFDAAVISGIVFVLSRCLSGFCALSFKSAREGSLSFFTGSSSKTAVRIITMAEALICLGAMAFFNPVYAAGITLTAVLTVIYYYFKTKKEFGGITGDTAGYFLLAFERNALVVPAVLCVLL